jgi:hypothetical protein
MEQFDERKEIKKKGASILFGCCVPFLPFVGHGKIGWGRKKKGVSFRSK